MSRPPRLGAALQREDQKHYAYMEVHGPGTKGIWTVLSRMLWYM